MQQSLILLNSTNASNLGESGKTPDCNVTLPVGMGESGKTPDRNVTLPVGIAMLICLILGLAGNLLIVVVILYRRNMRANLINLFITSLCINDLLNLLSNQSMVAASYLAHRWVLGHLLCDLMPELNMLLVCVSLWHHALIGLHRYIVVVHRNAYLGLHKGLYSACMLVGTRLFATLLSATHPLFNGGKWFNMTTYQGKMLRCIYTVDHKSRIGVVVLLTQLLPCLIVIACFAFIFVFVHRTGIRSTVADRLLLKRELQITKMFGAVFAMFLIGFLPYGCLRMLDSDNRLSPNAYVIVTLMYALASCTNPLIFGAMNTEIRTACLKLLGWKGGGGASGVTATAASRYIKGAAGSGGGVSGNGKRLLRGGVDEAEDAANNCQPTELT